jgi:hypothetical protein
VLFNHTELLLQIGRKDGELLAYLVDVILKKTLEIDNPQDQPGQKKLFGAEQLKIVETLRLIALRSETPEQFSCWVSYWITDTVEK